MKFSSALSTLVVVLPFLLPQVAAVPRGRFGGGNGFGGFGGFGGNKGSGANGANNGNAASSSAAAAASTTAAAGNAAASSAASSAAATSTAAAAAASTAAAAGVNNAAAGAGGDPQTSLTLDPSVIGSNLASNGLGANGTEAGQAPSLTSTNNFINFCVGKTITNGLQVQGGSCNPVPMGDIPAKANQPSCKFVFPKNMDNVAADTDFTIQMAISNLETGFFVNPNTNYFGAPQQLNGQGIIQGHSHVVIQAINGVQDTNAADPTVFAFFLGLNAAAQGGVLTADVAKGLPAGTYRLFSINTAANHQPVIGAVAQHGSFDDAVYFTVGDAAKAQALADVGAAAGAAAAGNAGAAAAGSAAAGSAAAGAASTTAAAGAATATAAGAAGAAGANTGAAATGAAGANTGAAATGAAGANAGAAAAGGNKNGGKNNKNKGGRRGRRAL